MLERVDRLRNAVVHELQVPQSPARGGHVATNVREFRGLSSESGTPFTADSYKVHLTKSTQKYLHMLQAGLLG